MFVRCWRLRLPRRLTHHPDRHHHHLPSCSSLTQAKRLLRPGGWIAISDFTVTPSHSCLTRTMWPAILGTDGVRPSVKHIATLESMFKPVHLVVDKGGFPYVPLLEAPFYYFVGKKSA